MRLLLLDAAGDAGAASIATAIGAAALSTARMAAFAFVSLVVPLTAVPRFARWFVLVVLCGGVTSGAVLRFGSLVASSRHGSSAPLANAGRGASGLASGLAVELALGAVLGLLVLGVFAAVRVCVGIVADSTADSRDGVPDTVGLRSSLGRVVDLIAISAFLSAGLHLTVIELVLASYESVPVGSLDVEAWRRLADDVLARALPNLLVGGIVLAVPVVTSVLSLAAVEGFLGRVLPESAIPRMVPGLRVALVVLAFGLLLPRTADATRTWCDESISIAARSIEPTSSSDGPAK
jgi:flagellar biosynthetic protein FliR